MIKLQRLNKEEFVCNADLIETLEATPDTVITLINGKKFMVKNSVDDIVKQVINYRRLCNQSIRVLAADATQANGATADRT